MGRKSFYEASEIWPSNKREGESKVGHSDLCKSQVEKSVVLFLTARNVLLKGLNIPRGSVATQHAQLVGVGEDKLTVMVSVLGQLC